MGVFSEMDLECRMAAEQNDMSGMEDIYAVLNAIYEGQEDRVDSAPGGMDPGDTPEEMKDRRAAQAASAARERQKSRPLPPREQAEQAEKRQSDSPAESAAGPDYGGPAEAESEAPPGKQTAGAGSAAGAEPPDYGDWPEPELPGTGAQLPAFPVADLPDFAADFIREMAVSTQTPVEMAGLLSLSVLAAAVQGRYTLRVRDDWTEPLSLYTMAVARSGERKSTVFSLLLQPVRAWEQARQQTDRQEAARLRATRETLEKKLETTQKAVAEGKSDMDAVTALSEELAGMQQFTPLQMLADDVTPEKLSILLSQQPQGILAASPEGGIFRTMIGTRDCPPNLDVYLKAWGAESIRVERVTRSSVLVEKPHLSILVTVQPSVLQKMTANEELMSRGLCARFLYVICTSSVGRRLPDPPAVTAAAHRAYQQGIQRLLEGSGTGELTLSPEADALRRWWMEQIEPALAARWDYDAMRAWGSKLTGQTLRIAGLLHAAEHPEPAAEPVSGETMRRAIRIARCLSRHAERAFRRPDNADDNLQYTLRRLQQLSVQHPLLTARVVSSGMTRFHRRSELDPYLDELKRRNCIRISRRRHAGGGRPMEVIELNPRLRSNG